jgi:aminomethyltransferase
MIRTSSYNVNIKLGAKMVDFAGWEMPVFYPGGIISEHKSVRNNVGLFDIGHMGIIKVSGKNASPFLQRVLTNDISKLNAGSAHYSLILNHSGGIIDDIFVYRMADDYIIVLNASNTKKDIEWFNSQNQENAVIKDLKPKMTLLALQGPKAQEVLQKFVDADLKTIGHHKIVNAKILGAPSMIARTGYTGEDGFELFIDSSITEKVWGSLIGSKVVPCGLGARDTLRLESGMPLYGHEYNEGITPLETPFMFAVKMDKGSFIGRDALAHHKEAGISKKLVGLKLNEMGIPRQGYRVFKDSDLIGYITSGTMSPTLNFPIAMGYIRVEHAAVGSFVGVEVRNRTYKAEVIKLPFYKRV